MMAAPVFQATTAPAGDDAVRPFQVDALDVRGRAVQMGPALDQLLGRHDYPPAVAKLVAEATVLTALLGASLKFDGKFILQTQTDGPVSMLVVDFRTPGDLRAYASFDEKAVAEADAAGETNSGQLLGRGTLAMTIDQGPDMTRYQGVVALEGESLEEVAHAYFRQSEQIPTKVRLAAAELLVRGDGEPRRLWRAGGVLAQFMPAVAERLPRIDLPGGDAPAGAAANEDKFDEDDSWRETQLLVETVEDHELVDPDVPVERLLYRLFHERGVRVYEPTPLHDQCSCNRGRIERVLRSFSADAIEESVEDGAIRVTCEFCGTNYEFDPDEFRTDAGDS
jgi:molecular chaperone Hsp33